MRIDVHAHYWTDAYLDMLVELGRTDTATQRGIGADGGAELDARLRLMDRAGVDVQVLSAAPQLRTVRGHDRRDAADHGRALQRYPSVRIICSHLGGALPMLTRRADDHLKWEAPDTPEAPSLAVRRLWYDTVSHCHAPALRCAIETFGADRIVLGTDFPYEDGDTFVRAIDYVADAADPEQQRAILELNAMALFGLEAP
jgi:predicted TIM-barrel fold metal-dependent hydrolase